MSMISEIRKDSFFNGTNLFFNILKSSITRQEAVDVVENLKSSSEDMQKYGAVLLYMFFCEFSAGYQPNTSGSTALTAAFDKDLSSLFNAADECDNGDVLMPYILPNILKIADRLHTIFASTQAKKSSYFPNMTFYTLKMGIDDYYSSSDFHFSLRKQVIAEFKTNFFGWHKQTIKDFTSGLNELGMFFVHSFQEPDDQESAVVTTFKHKYYAFIQKEICGLIDDLSYLSRCFIKNNCETKRAGKLLKSMNYSARADRVLAAQTISEFLNVLKVDHFVIDIPC